MGSPNEIKIEDTSTETLNNSMLMNNEGNSSLKVMPVNECKEKRKIIVIQDSTAVIIMGLVFLVIVIGLFYFLPKWSPSEPCRGVAGNFSQKSTDSLINANQVHEEDEDYYCTSSQTDGTPKMHSANSITFAPSTYWILSPQES